MRELRSSERTRGGQHCRPGARESRPAGVGAWGAGRGCEAAGARHSAVPVHQVPDGDDGGAERGADEEAVHSSGDWLGAGAVRPVDAESVGRAGAGESVEAVGGNGRLPVAVAAAVGRGGPGGPSLWMRPSDAEGLVTAEGGGADGSPPRKPRPAEPRATVIGCPGVPRGDAGSLRGSNRIPAATDS